MKLTPVDTDVPAANDDAFDAADDEDVDMNFQQYELNETETIVIGNSLGTDVTMPADYLVAYDYEGPTEMETRYSAAMQAFGELDDETAQAVQSQQADSVDEFVEAMREEADVDIPDTVSGAELYHADADGQIGLTLLSTEDATIDDIVDEFVERDGVCYDKDD